MRCILISDLVLYAGKSIYCTHREKGKCILSQAMLEWMQYSFHHFLHRGVFTHSPPCRTLGDTGDATMPPPRPLPSGAPSPSLPPASAPRWRRPPTAKRYRGRLPLVVALVAAWLGWGRQWQLVDAGKPGQRPWGRGGGDVWRSAVPGAVAASRPRIWGPSPDPVGSAAPAVDQARTRQFWLAPADL